MHYVIMHDSLDLAFLFINNNLHKNILHNNPHLKHHITLSNYYKINSRLDEIHIPYNNPHLNHHLTQNKYYKFISMLDKICILHSILPQLLSYLNVIYNPYYKISSSIVTNHPYFEILM